VEKIGFKPGVKSEAVVDGAIANDDELVCVKWIECKEFENFRIWVTK